MGNRSVPCKAAASRPKTEVKSERSDVRGSQGCASTSARMRWLSSAGSINTAPGPAAALATLRAAVRSRSRCSCPSRATSQPASDSERARTAGSARARSGSALAPAATPAA